MRRDPRGALILVASTVLCCAVPAVGEQLAQEQAGKDGAPMVFVPAGAFEMGSGEHEGEPDERPKHRVFLDAYYMDRYQFNWRAANRTDMIPTNRLMSFGFRCTQDAPR